MNRLLWKGIWKRNVKNRVLFPVILFLTAVPILIYGTVQNLMHEVEEEQIAIYGKYTHIYYEEVSDPSADLSAPTEDFVYMERGILTVTKVLTAESGKEYTCGSVDEAAVGLGCLRVKEGKLPEQSGEAALTEAAREEFAPDAEVGDIISLEDRQVLLTGVLADYGRLWPSGEQQAQSHFRAPSVILAAEDAAQGSILGRIHLYTADTSNLNQSGDGEDFFVNTNSLTIESDIFTIPAVFVVLFAVCALLILYYLLVLCRNTVVKRISVYELCGMLHREAVRLLMEETLVIAAIAGLAGLGVGFLGYYLTGLWVQETIGYTFRWRWYPEFLLIVLGVLCFVMAAQGIFVALDLRSWKKSRHREPRLHEARPARFLRLLRIDIRRTGKGFLLGGVLLACLMTTWLGSEIYEKLFVRATTHTELSGKMPYDYDYELSAFTVNTAPRDGDYGFDIDDREWNGLTDESVEELRDIPGVAEVKAYREDDKCRVLVKEQDMDDYLDVSDSSSGEPDGEYRAPDDLDNVKELFGYADDDLLVQSLISGHTEEELLSYASEVTDGEINLEKLRRGEEVILMVPSLVVEEGTEEDGSAYVSRKRVAAGTAGSYSNTLWKAGDEITLSELVSSQAVNGTVMMDEAAELFSRMDKTVKIGAVISGYVGWFEDSGRIAETYYILTLSDAFPALGLSARYNHVRIYLSADADPSEVRESVYEILEDYPYVSCEDYQMEMANYRQMRFLISLSSRCILGFLALAAVCSIMGQTLAKLRIHRKQYLLLEINGLERRRIAMLWLLENLLLGVIGTAAAAAVLPAVVRLSFSTDLGMVFGELGLMSASDVWICIGCVFGLLFLSVLPALRILRRTSLRECLSGE